MRRTDRTILVAVPLLALLVGLWFLVIGPKRDEVGELDDQIAALQTSIDASQATIAAAEAAREEFPRNYGELVSLGRAVPEDSDQATFIYDMAGLGKDNDVEFRNFELTAGGDAGAASTPSPPPTPEAEAPSGEEASEDTAPGGTAAGASAALSNPAPATEAVAATLPIGATVGPAGLPVVPYEFKFFGNFFDMADFFADVDRSVVVSEKTGKPKVDGRLVTIDSFELSADPVSGFPDVEANFAVTTYTVPAEQGLGAGATPAGPAPVGSPAAPAPTSATSTPAATIGGTP